MDLIGTLRRLFERTIPFLGVVLFGLALLVLRHELAGIPWGEVRAGLGAIPLPALVAAAGLTALSFLVLGAYDRLGVRYTQAALAEVRTGLASFLAFAFSHALGFPLFTGAPVRYRLYSFWGLTTDQILRIVVFVTTTFWVGVLAVGGAILLTAPPPLPDSIPLPPVGMRVIGALLLVALAAYLAWGANPAREVRVAGFTFPAPGLPLALRQILVASIDWAVLALVLFVLLPAGHGIGPLHFFGIFLIAQVVGQLSHVPGGLGVVEAVLVLLLPAAVVDPALVASLLVWRAIYFLGPLLIAMALLGWWELRAGRRVIGRTADRIGRGATLASPVLLAGGTFVAGALLLAFGAVPTPPRHLLWVEGFLPLAAFEASHLLASLAGAALLVLSWGLVQRISAAYHLTLAILALGIVLSLVRGLEVVPAVTLAVVLIALVPARAEFFREASLTAEPFSPGWIALILVSLMAAGWIALLVGAGEVMTTELWWTFTLQGDSPRIVRALTGAACGLLLFGVVRLLRPVVPAELSRPAGAPSDEIEAIAQGSERAAALLVLTGDKNIMMSEDRRGFIMYAVEGRSWVSLGDPLGDPEAAEELIWRFRALSHRYAGWPVFYQVRPDRLPLYLDAGLSLLKLGEEARIALPDLVFDGPRFKDFRQTLNRAEREGVEFALLPPEEVAPHLPELREISDLWLGARSTREKGFSVGSFDEAYLCRTPIGVARREGTILGFVNALAPERRDEMSADLMRYRPDAMKGVMDFLFAKLLLEGKARGYRHFSLGMAPLSGFDNRPLSPLWSRLGAAVFRHGEHFYNFQGLRAYKEKFGPHWEARYLASPGGLSLPRVLTNVGSLIAGGLTGIVRR
jgi:phosphatidylglycerol lysyltransferase